MHLILLFIFGIWVADGQICGHKDCICYDRTGLITCLRKNLKSIPDFTRIPGSYRWLDLRWNNIKNITYTPFLRNLQRIDLRGNPINCSLLPMFENIVNDCFHNESSTLSRPLRRSTTPVPRQQKKKVIQKNHILSSFSTRLLRRTTTAAVPPHQKNEEIQKGHILSSLTTAVPPNQKNKLIQKGIIFTAPTTVISTGTLQRSSETKTPKKPKSEFISEIASTSISKELKVHTQALFHMTTEEDRYKITSLSPSTSLDQSGTIVIRPSNWPDSRKFKNIEMTIKTESVDMEEASIDFYLHVTLGPLGVLYVIASVFVIIKQWIRRRRYRLNM